MVKFEIGFFFGFLECQAAVYSVYSVLVRSFFFFRGSGSLSWQEKELAKDQGSAAPHPCLVVDLEIFLAIWEPRWSPAMAR